MGCYRIYGEKFVKAETKRKIIAFFIAPLVCAIAFALYVSLQDGMFRNFMTNLFLSSLFSYVISLIPGLLFSLITTHLHIKNHIICTALGTFIGLTIMTILNLIFDRNFNAIDTDSLFFGGAMGFLYAFTYSVIVFRKEKLTDKDIKQTANIFE